MKTKVAVLILTFATATAAAEDDTLPVEEVVITGTTIKRINAETALPVQVLKAEDIERTGASTVEELIRTLASVDSAGGRTTAQQTGAQTGAISTISLRGLGSSRTLVLIDGKRSTVYGGAAANAAGSSVDIASLPVSMIERVEILKDGASAIYGSDAIAGVVNFIRPRIPAAAPKSRYPLSPAPEI
jgi:iron complex outermembrane receptor protein